MLSLISVLGTTATGKSHLGLDLAEALRSNIISADSKQVFRDTLVLSAGQLPEEFRLDIDGPIPNYHKDSLKVFGIGNVVDPSTEWSMGEFVDLVRDAVTNYYLDTIILVGGTGLYHRRLSEFLEGKSPQVPPNPEIRAKAEVMSAVELQEWLRSLSPKELDSMNQSDRSNPRRLVRRIENLLSKPAESKDPLPHQHLKIGLELDDDKIEGLIRERIEQRFEGSLKEVASLYTKYGKLILKAQIADTVGFKSLVDHLDGLLDKEQAVEDWFVEERQLLKQQSTWYQTEPDVHWFRADKSDLFATVKRTIDHWL